MFIKCEEEMVGKRLGEETVKRRISSELLTLEVLKTGFLDPFNKLFLVVAELDITTPLNSVNLSPRLSRFLHGVVVLLVEALPARH